HKPSPDRTGHGDAQDIAMEGDIGGDPHEFAWRAVPRSDVVSSSVWTADMGNRCAGTWVTHDPLIWGSPG
ncbi:hypothetical protein, partial [Paraburkholderia atlantica]|uniref:hypothetical protein n=1 Tax=Paraburkholderia atlantica TaxID=2654982 RepID=UPI001C376687